MTLFTPNEQNKIVLYQPDNAISVEVRVDSETVWLTQAQMTLLFNRNKSVISRHIKNIFAEKELSEEATVANFATVQLENGRYVERQIEYYNLDVIISVGYRVKSKQGTLFRQWATRTLRSYMLHGHSANGLNQRFERIEYRLQETERKIDFFVQTALPPLQGIFYDGQIFEAYAFVAQLVKAAKQSIILIDNYVDESVLLLLSKRAQKVSAEIYTANLSAQLQLDIERHNAQFPPIDLHINRRFHDRFLLIDNEVYHIGASLKDLGKKLFAFSKMACPKEHLFSNPINQ